MSDDLMRLADHIEHIEANAVAAYTDAVILGSVDVTRTSEANFVRGYMASAIRFLAADIRTLARVIDRDEVAA